MNELTVRLFEPGDAEHISALIRRTIREVNGRDYAPEALACIVEQYSPTYVAAIAAEGALYVAQAEDGTYMGCGGITSHWNDPGAGYILAVFTNPDHLGRGIGGKVMAAIESDPLFLGASRVELHAAVTARGFYEKLGYSHESDVPKLTDGCYYMEKKKAAP